MCFSLEGIQLAAIFPLIPSRYIVPPTNSHIEDALNVKTLYNNYEHLSGFYYIHAPEETLRCYFSVYFMLQCSDK